MFTHTPCTALDNTSPQKRTTIGLFIEPFIENTLHIMFSVVMLSARLGHSVGVKSAPFVVAEFVCNQFIYSSGQHETAPH